MPLKSGYGPVGKKGKATIGPNPNRQKRERRAIRKALETRPMLTIDVPEMDPGQEAALVDLVKTYRR